MTTDTIKHKGKATLGGIRRYESKMYIKIPDKSAPGSASKLSGVLENRW
jgi:hypothetical protein